MKIELQPKIEAILKARVAAGHFESVEDAVAAAVLGVRLDPNDLKDLAWARSYIDAARASFARGEGVDDEQVWDEIEQRFGSLG